MVGCTRRPGKRAEVRFADPPWNEQSAEWQIRDQQVPADHPAREVVEAMKHLDLTPLFALYLGRGSRPIRPDLMLAIVADRNPLGAAAARPVVPRHGRTLCSNGRASGSGRRGLVGTTLPIASRPCSNSGMRRCFKLLGNGE